MGARVKAYDPVAMDVCKQQHPDLRIHYAASAMDAAEEADAIVVVTEWKEFAALDLRSLADRMRLPVLIDGRNIYNPDAAAAAGFDYTGIGRPHKAARKAAAADPIPASH
jgi:UDPglucose 6-dehydrogenase